MFKNILFAFCIAFFSACSAPKPDTPPTWYTSPPKDYKFFYAAASGSSETLAKNKAVVSLRTLLIQELNQEFIKEDHKLAPFSEKELQNIFALNEKLAKTLPIRNIAVEKSQSYNGEELVLIKVPREDIFKVAQNLCDEKIEQLSQDYKAIKSEEAIFLYTQLFPLQANIQELASCTQLKTSSIATFHPNKHFTLLKSIKDQFMQLQNEISFYLVSDANSLIFMPHLKELFEEQNLKLAPRDNYRYKLIVTSSTDEDQEYDFLRSKSLVRLHLYDNTNKELAFRQHTFAAKSRKDYQDAKIQSAIHFKGQAKRVGLYSFIGLEAK